jgi:hypothetical protein
MAKEKELQKFRLTWHGPVINTDYWVLGYSLDDAKCTLDRYQMSEPTPPGYVTEITDDVPTLKTQILTHRPMVNGKYEEIPVVYYLCSKCGGTHLMTPANILHTEGRELTSEQMIQFSRYADRADEIEAALAQKFAGKRC